MKDLSKLSEAELLTRVLTGLSDQKTFELGVLMGVMHKGDAVLIARLEQRIGELERECNTLRSFRNEEAIAGDGKG